MRIQLVKVSDAKTTYVFLIMFQVRSFLQPPMRGVVMLSFGSGNVPDRSEPILRELQRGTEKGIIIVNCSQCSRGFVTDKYAAGRVRSL